MPAEEYFLWRAYDADSPISDVRADVLSAIVAAAPLQAAGMKVSAKDMLPPWAKRVEEDQQQEDDEDKAETFFAFLRGKAAATAAKPETADSVPLP